MTRLHPLLLLLLHGVQCGPNILVGLRFYNIFCCNDPLMFLQSLVIVTGIKHTRNRGILGRKIRTQAKCNQKRGTRFFRKKRQSGSLVFKEKRFLKQPFAVSAVELLFVLKRVEPFLKHRWNFPSEWGTVLV